MCESLVSLRCGQCDVFYAMSETLYNARRKDGETFYCPNGHARHFRETEADRLRRSRDSLLTQLAQKDESIKARDRMLSAARGQVTKLKNRVLA